MKAFQHKTPRRSGVADQPDPLVPIVGSRLGAAMVMAELSFPGLAEALKARGVRITFQALHLLEQGRRKRTRQRVRAAIADACEVTEGYLAGEPVGDRDPASERNDPHNSVEHLRVMLAAREARCWAPVIPSLDTAAGRAHLRRWLSLDVELEAIFGEPVREDIYGARIRYARARADTLRLLRLPLDWPRRRKRKASAQAVRGLLGWFE